MSDLPTALVVAAAVGCGLNAGVFFAFSSFVMPGLGRLRPAEGAAAMQAINVTAVTPAFMTALFGTAALCVAVAGWALADGGTEHRATLVAGAALYLLGTIGMTVVFHVPRNDALARLDPRAPETADAWTGYLRSWTRGNHVRTAAALAAAVLLTAAAVG